MHLMRCGKKFFKCFCYWKEGSNYSMFFQNGNHVLKIILQPIIKGKSTHFFWDFSLRCTKHIINSSYFKVIFQEYNLSFKLVHRTWIKSSTILTRIFNIVIFYYYMFIL